jgi:hypothetical protein
MLKFNRRNVVEKRNTKVPGLDKTTHIVASLTPFVLVILTLFYFFTRRQVEVTNCFAVPHAERGDEVAIGKDFNKQMLSLHLRANRKEQVVGWYASCAGGHGEIADTSSLIHEF